VTRPSLVFVHSPVLGPTSVQGWARASSALGWICVVPSMTEADSVTGHVAVAAAGVPDGAVLVAHSGAGALVPGIAAVAALSDRRVTGAVFVDARIPARTGATAIAEPAMLEFLGDRAVDGLVPPWSQWWGDETFAALVPDPALAAGLRAEMRHLPLDFFRAQVPVPPDWPARPCGYLQLSPAYDAEFTEARARGWTCARRDGTHLDVATRPESTAVALDRILEQML